MEGEEVVVVLPLHIQVEILRLMMQILMRQAGQEETYRKQEKMDLHILRTHRQMSLIFLKDLPINLITTRQHGLWQVQQLDNIAIQIHLHR